MPRWRRLHKAAVAQFLIFGISCATDCFTSSTFAQEHPAITAYGQARELHNARKYAEALPFGEEAVRLTKELVGPNHSGYATTVEALGAIHEGLKNYGEAEALFKLSLAIRERALGRDHPDVTLSLSRLADLYRKVGRHGEAEPYYERIVAKEGQLNDGLAVLLERARTYLGEKRSGEAEILLKRILQIMEAQPLGEKRRDEPDTTAILLMLHNIYWVQKGRFPERESILKRALTIEEKRFAAAEDKVIGSIQLLECLNLLAMNYSLGPSPERVAQPGKAERLYLRALDIRERTLGPDHHEVAQTLLALANLNYHQQYRYNEAEKLYERALAITEKALGAEGLSEIARNELQGQYYITLHFLAEMYVFLGRYGDAERLHARVVSIVEKMIVDKTSGMGGDHIALALDSLGLGLQAQGRHTEAGNLFARAIAILSGNPGFHDHLAKSLAAQGRYGEAESSFMRARAIREKWSLDPDDLSSVSTGLPDMYRAQGRYREAEELYVRAIAIYEKSRAADKPTLVPILNALGSVRQAQGRYDEAHTLFIGALAIADKQLGPDHSMVADTLHHLGRLAYARSHWVDAYTFLTRTATVEAKRVFTASGAGEPSDAPNAGHHVFLDLIRVCWRLAREQPDRMNELLTTSFAAAQWAIRNPTSTSLMQMGVRQAKGDGPLEKLVRERQDLVAERKAREKLLIAAISQPMQNRDSLAEQEHRARLAVIERRMTEIDTAWVKDFPEYAELVNPQPLRVSDLQTRLHTNEALVLVVDLPEQEPTREETFVWVITKTHARWVRSEVSPRALNEIVAILRCGLDQAAWEDEGTDRCAALLKQGSGPTYAAAGQSLPFDLRRAHELYLALFGQVEDLIQNKDLLVVTTGALSAIPLHVLVTDAPSVAIPANAGGYASAAWLAKRHAVTVLPSVTSITALREFAKSSGAAQPFIGFGNPLLTGPSGADKRAWAHQTCPRPAAALAEIRRRSAKGSISRYFLGNLANVELVRRQHPLPETADELCAVAHSVGSSDAAIYLGEKASESVVRTLSANGILANARIVHFATHGLLASESKSLGVSRGEPALILTPPSQPTVEDDGLLTASEVTKLKLSADWVVLSACNTAAGGDGQLNSEALSGLARAFFYAGARALLVSHWAVDSQATVRLVTKTFDAMRTNTKVGRAEALRRSMMMLASTVGRNAHPAIWAPFVVVGEGRL